MHRGIAEPWPHGVRGARKTRRATTNRIHLTMRLDEWQIGERSSARSTQFRCASESRMHPCMHATLICNCLPQVCYTTRRHMNAQRPSGSIFFELPAAAGHTPRLPTSPFWGGVKKRTPHPHGPLLWEAHPIDLRDQIHINSFYISCLLLFCGRALIPTSLFSRLLGEY